MASDGESSASTQGSGGPPPVRLRLGWRLVLLNLLLLALLSALVLLTQSVSRRNFTQRALVATENLANTLAQSVGAEIDRIDIVLRTAVLAVEAEQARAPLQAARVDAVLAQQQSLLPQLDSLRIADAQGVVRYGNGVVAEARVDLSDRGFFIAARRAPQRGPVISEPLLARISKKWVIAVARPLRQPDGSFAGVVYANVPVDHFQGLLGAVDLGRQGAISLRGVARSLVARRTASGEAPTGIGSRNVSQELLQALQAQPEGGTYVARTALDGIERANAYRQVGSHPMRVIVGLATDDFLGPWRTQTRQVAALALLAVLTLAAASGLLYRAWTREGRSSQALIREGERHRALLRAASDGMHVVDRGGRLVEASDSFAAMLGYRRDELLGRHVGFWDAELSAAAIERRLGAFEVGQLTQFGSRHRRSDGRLIDVEVSSLGARIEGQELLYCSARDVTEREAQARELEQHRHHLEELVEVRTAQWRASELRFRALVEQSLVGVFVQANNQFSFVNPAFAAIFGYGSAEEIVARVAADSLVAPADRERFNAVGPRVVSARERMTQLAFTGLRRDGTRIELEVYASPIQDEGGPAAIGLLLDVTAQRRAEAERGAALVREQGLRSAAERQAESLRELLEQREEFVRVLAHEVRQPLNNASAALQSAAAGLAAGSVVDARAAAQRIGRAQTVIGQIVAVLDNTLAAATLLASPQELDGRDADVGMLIDLSLGDLEVAARPRVRVERISSTRTATMDIGLLRLALRNVLGNALAYSPSGSEVVLRVVDSDEPLALVFEVADRGPGIGDELRPHLFERGARGSHGLPGYGIGLHVVQRVMQMHGGHVDLLPNLPTGTVFRLWLPQGQ